MDRITLQEFVDALSRLPKEVLDKEVFYIDFSNVNRVDLEEMIERLKNDEETQIRMY
jgi:hypothetical protein